MLTVCLGYNIVHFPEKIVFGRIKMIKIKYLWIIESGELIRDGISVIDANFWYPASSLKTIDMAWSFSM